MDGNVRRELSGRIEVCVEQSFFKAKQIDRCPVRFGFELNRQEHSEEQRLCRASFVKLDHTGTFNAGVVCFLDATVQGVQYFDT